MTTPVIFDRELPDGRLFRNVAEVPRFEVERMARLLGDEMSAAYELDVPLIVDVRVGPNWDEMQRLDVPATANA